MVFLLNFCAKYKISDFLFTYEINKIVVIVVEIIIGMAFNTKKSFKKNAQIDNKIYKSGYRLSFFDFFKLIPNQSKEIKKIIILTF